jgi:hypothetical protein
MDIPNHLVYACGSNRFREIMDNLEERRFVRRGSLNFGILDTMYHKGQYCILKSRDERWMILEIQGEKIAVSYMSTLDFILSFSADDVYTILGEARLLHPSENHFFLMERIRAHQAALEHKEREQLKKLREKYPDEVSQ